MNTNWNKEINEKLTEILQVAANDIAKVLLSADGLTTNPEESCPFQYFNNVLCIQGGALYGNKIMTKSNYGCLKKRHFESIRRGCNNTPALIAFESIPKRFKEKVINEFGDPYKLIKIKL